MAGNAILVHQTDHTENRNCSDRDSEDLVLKFKINIMLTKNKFLWILSVTA